MHSAGGGQSSATAGLIPVFLLAIVVARGVQGRPGSTLRIVAMLGLGQVAVHVAMSPTSHGGSAGVHHVSAPLHAVGAHAGTLRRSGEAYGPQLAAAVGDALGCLVAQPGMLIGHVVVAVTVGWWLAAGERLSLQAIALLVQWSAQSVAAMGTALRIPPVWPAARAAIRFDEQGTPPLTRLFLVAGTIHRGPPVAVTPTFT